MKVPLPVLVQLATIDWNKVEGKVDITAHCKNVPEGKIVWAEIVKEEESGRISS